MRIQALTGVALASLLATPMLAHAESDERSDRGRGHHGGPPPQAFEACSNLSESAQCTFEGRRGDVTGTCRIGRDEQQTLVCAPIRRPRNRSDEDNQGTSGEPG